MKTSIVIKLFLFTSALCMIIVASIYFGQTLFFEYYYENNKINSLSDAVDAFKKDYINSAENETTQGLEQQFYQENNAWIVALDENGYIKGAPPLNVEIDGGFVSDKVEVEYTDENFITPIEYLFDSYDSETLSVLENEENLVVEIHGIENGGIFYPYEIILTTTEVANGNSPAYSPLNGTTEGVRSFTNQSLESKIRQKQNQSGFVEKVYYGDVESIQIPSNFGLTYSAPLTSRTFFEQIKEFQVELIFNELTPDTQEQRTMDYEENGINYKILIDQEQTTDGETTYFLTMASLQPINEAVGMMRQYYVYIIIGVVVLILFAAFYYSKMIARPLIKLNNSAKRMADLDFSKRVDIHSKDEIGELAQNINFLSDSLHDHIKVLQRDIEKERQLENTRKEFIAGISHELKTPLSIMKSCISILQDEVAIEKRAHFFSAMDKEVNRMDRLIVDMLELAKFESGTYKMKKETFALDVLVEDIYQQLFIQLEKKDLTVQMQLDKVEILANEHWIEQVVTNFFTNAIRHTPVHQNINLAVVEENDKIRLSIENEGSAIEEAQLDNIWDRFYQIKKTQRSKEGTGIGLAISKNILELHHAEYGVHNTDSGVEFYFYLDKADALD